MATLKLSQIANAPSNFGNTDTVVGVRTNNTDLQYSFSQVVGGLQSSGSIRTILTANTTFFVSTSGSDSNPGTLALPWATIQHAYNFIATLDGGGFVAKIQVENGTYAGAIVSTPTVGFANVILIGTISNETSVIIVDTGLAAALDFSATGNWEIDWLTLQVSTANNDGLTVGGNSDAEGVSVYYSNILFKANGVTGQYCQGLFTNLCSITGGVIGFSDGLFSIQGAWVGALFVNGQNAPIFAEHSCTFIGSVSFSDAFVVGANSGASINTRALNWIGTVTGNFYDISQGTIFFDSSSVWPGTAGGFLSNSIYESENNGPSTSIRLQLSGAFSFFISATGSDSNNGLSATSAWATLQHAMFFIAANIDLAGFIVTVNIGTGSFAGFGYVGCVGGGTVQFLGNGVANTTITNGPNDGVFNFGDCIDIEQISNTGLYIDACKLIPTGTTAFEVDVFNPNCGFGTLATLGGTGITVAFPAGGSTAAVIVGAPGAFFNIFCPVTVDGTLGGAALALLSQEAAFLIVLTAMTFVGTPAFSVATVQASSFGRFFWDAGVIVGGATGQRFKVLSAGAIFGTGIGVLGPTFFPGNSAGTCDVSSSYDFFSGPLPGINTQTANYTLAITDVGEIVEMNLAGANTVTVPLNATVAFEIGTKIWVTQIGAGNTTIQGAVGVTVDNAGALSGQWATAKIYKRGTNEWVQTNA